MHSHEKTLLAKFGFSDPDRRIPLHDLACQYLLTETVEKRLVQYLDIEHGLKHSEGPEHKCDFSRRVVAIKGSLEQEVSKGEGQYRTTIGFADVVLRFKIEDHNINYANLTNGVWIPQTDMNCLSVISCGIEVKITPTTIGDVLRQINLYRSYSRFDYWALVTHYPLTTNDAECLRSEKILHFQLGSHFKAFQDQQAQQGYEPGMEL